MELLHNDRVDIRLYSPQALAFLGDAVYEILVRERIVHKANMPVNKLHLQAVEQVRASYQSRAYAVIEPMLDEDVYKRQENFFFRMGVKRFLRVEGRLQLKYQSSHLGIG